MQESEGIEEDDMGTLDIGAKLKEMLANAEFDLSTILEIILVFMSVILLIIGIVMLKTIKKLN